MNLLVIAISILVWIIFQHDGGLLALFIGPLLLAFLHNNRNEDSGSSEISES